MPPMTIFAHEPNFKQETLKLGVLTLPKWDSNYFFLVKSPLFQGISEEGLARKMLGLYVQGI
jgi:hypothetical protein